MIIIGTVVLLVLMIIIFVQKLMFTNSETKTIQWTKENMNEKQFRYWLENNNFYGFEDKNKI